MHAYGLVPRNSFLRYWAFYPTEEFFLLLLLHIFELPYTAVQKLKNILMTLNRRPLIQVFYFKTTKKMAAQARQFLQTKPFKSHILKKIFINNRCSKT